MEDEAFVKAEKDRGGAKVELSRETGEEVEGASDVDGTQGSKD